ncbi:MAG: hypothetical protein GXO90_06705 [FCB group bacterium]|nr:hypothetical protein [FCB group bacterium]
MNSFSEKTRKLLSAILIISLLNLFFGCAFQVQNRTIPLGAPLIIEKNNVVILHIGPKSFQLTDAKMVYPNLVGNLAPYRPPIFSSAKINEVHLYLSADKILKLGEKNSTQIPLVDIQKIEVVDIDIGKTILYYTLGAAVSAGLFVLLVAIFKESCPFVYVYNGEDYAFVGEIYSGAIYPNLERHDYLVLPDAIGQDRTVKIRITNEVREIQHTNMTELILYDHNPDVQVLTDKYGQVHTVSYPQTADSAITLNGVPLGTELSFRDSVSYSNFAMGGTESLVDGVILSFTRSGNADTGKLILRGKNSFWLDYTLSTLADELGNRYEKWHLDQKQKSRETLVQQSLDNGIPLKVYLEKNGKWEYVDYFNVVGPMALKDDILSLNLEGIQGETVRVKLEYGFLFWDLDYAAMDFSPDQSVSVYSLPPVSAVTQTGENMVTVLSRDDSLYYVQPVIGDQVNLTFEIPEVSPGQARTMVLHSKGYYEAIRDPSGTADLARLRKYRKPGGLIEYSRDHFRQLLNQE